MTQHLIATSTHGESEFYVSKVQPTRLELCCYCAGEFNSLLELNTSLKALDGPYSVVLPIRKACLDCGCIIVVRAARQNAKAKHARMEVNSRDREALRAEVLAADEAREARVVTTTYSFGGGANIAKK